MPDPIPITAAKKSALERALSIFTHIKAGEGVSALLLALNVFLLLGSYYLLKTVREPLILTEAGAEIKSYASAGQALLLLFVIPAYGAIAGRVNRVRLITWVTLFFVSNLAIFYVLGQAGLHVGVAFFLWVGIFNVLVIAQFWAFANDVFTEEQGKRLFPMVGVGASLGAWVGSTSAGQLFGAFEPAIAPYALMLITGAILTLTLLITREVSRREQGRERDQTEEKAEKPLGKEGGFKLVFSQRYLFLIAMLILLLNVVNTTGGYMLDSVATAEAARTVDSGSGSEDEKEAETKAILGRFYGSFYGWQNLLGFLFQLILVSRIFKYIGVRGAMYILPCLALGSYTLLIFMPLLGVVRIAKIVENSTDYSIQNTARHALFLPTSREAKYKAKAAIDTMFWRLGDLLQAGIVFVGTSLAFTISNFAMVNVALVAIWLCLVVAINREHKKISVDEPAEQLEQAA